MFNEELLPRVETSPLTPPKQRTLAEDVVERLRQAIQRGYFAPGEPLRTERVAAMLEVSRGPVREALTQLEREGLVLIRRRRGAYVARLSRKDVDEVYSLRFPLEQFALRCALRRAREEDFAAMEEILGVFVEATASAIAGQAWAELDIRFHDLLYRAARHQRLFDCWTLLRAQVHVLVLSAYASWPDFFRERTVKRHQEILDALRDRDEERALSRSAEHLHDAYLHVVSSYPEEETTVDLPFLPFDPYLLSIQ